MSQESVDLVRRYLETWNEAGGYRGTSQFRHPQFELHDVPQLPDPDVWIGEDEACARVDSYIEDLGWDNIFRVEKLIDAGDDVVVAWCRLKGSSPGGEMPLDWNFAHVLFIEGDRIRRVLQFVDLDEALKAAGLSE